MPSDKDKSDSAAEFLRLFRRIGLAIGGACLAYGIATALNAGHNADNYQLPAAIGGGFLGFFFPKITEK